MVVFPFAHPLKVLCAGLIAGYGLPIDQTALNLRAAAATASTAMQRILAMILAEAGSASSMPVVSSHDDPTRNPWNPQRHVARRSGQATAAY